MKIIDVNERYFPTYACCFEDWSKEMKNAVTPKRKWYNSLKDKGLCIKIATDNDDNAVGLIHYLPAEYSFIDAKKMYFIPCIWVHGYRDKGVGDQQKQGIGKKLLEAAVNHVKKIGAHGIAAWGLSEAFWMPVAFYKHFGFVTTDKIGIQELVWHPFTKEVKPPKWLKSRKPKKVEGKTLITAFISGWCTAYNVGFNNFRKAAKELGVEFRVIDTLDTKAIQKWKQTDAIYINDEEINLGPPPSYKETLRIIKQKMY